MFRFWLKITKTNNCFERINLYRLFVHIKTMCNSKVNSQFWFNADFKSRLIQTKVNFLRNSVILCLKQKQMSVNGVCETCFPFELGWFLLLADIWYYLIQKCTLFWYISLKSKLFIVSFLHRDFKFNAFLDICTEKLLYHYHYFCVVLFDGTIKVIFMLYFL